jgi:hypothetical protein
VDCIYIFTITGVYSHGNENFLISNMEGAVRIVYHSASDLASFCSGPVAKCLKRCVHRGQLCCAHAEVLNNFYEDICVDGNIIGGI